MTTLKFMIFSLSISTLSFAASPVQVNSINSLDLILQSGLMAKLVLVLLLVSSVFSWAVIFSKLKAISAAHQDSKAFLKTFWQGHDLEEIYSKSDAYGRSPITQVFKAGFKELKKLSQIEGKPQVLMQTHSIDNIRRSLYRTMFSEVADLEKRVGSLATIAAATPFVGLFGTVWGIMNSFQGIGASGNANLAVVAPGISEALIATAAGLGTAIPAVVFYNYISNRIRQLSSNVEGFCNDFLNLIQRNLLKSSHSGK